MAPGADPHAGRRETSVKLHLSSEDVGTAASVAGVTRPRADLVPELIAGGVLAVSPSECSTTRPEQRPKKERNQWS